MQIREWMTPVPMTVTLDTTVAQARALMLEKQIRHLPVCEYDRLVGIVTDRDIRMALPSPATSLSVWEIHHLMNKLTVDAVMTGAVITIRPDAAVAEAVRLIVANKIGALPVTDGGRLVGIITETDLLRAFSVVLGEPVDVRMAVPAHPGHHAFFEVRR